MTGSMRWLATAAAAACAVLVSVEASAQTVDTFPFKNRDRVVFLGDSNTRGNFFVDLVEEYTILRFPTRKVTFFNVGIGGDTAEGGVERFERDVLSKDPTVVFVTYGPNDVFQYPLERFVAAIETMVNTARSHNIRIYICTYPLLGIDAAVLNPTLRTWGDAAVARATALGALSVDVSRRMEAIVGPTPPDRLYFVPDIAINGLHLNDVGHNLWAFTLLQGIGAPAETSSVTINAATLAASASGATVSGVSGGPTSLQFARLDLGLPITFGGPLSGFSIGFVPWDQIAAYNLRITNLAAGKYEIRAEGLQVTGILPQAQGGDSTLSDAQLAAGVSIRARSANPFADSGPWGVKSTTVRTYVTGRAAIALGTQDQLQALPADPKAGSLRSQQNSLNNTIGDVARLAATPYPFHFEVVRVGP